MLPIVPVLRADDTVIHIRGHVHGIYTVAPICVRYRQFTSAGWTVRCKQTGMSVAKFSNLRIARQFADFLMREYGDISVSLLNSFNRQETEEDAALLDEINVRSMHFTRLKKGDIIQYIPIPDEYQVEVARKV